MKVYLNASLWSFLHMKRIFTWRNKSVSKSLSRTHLPFSYIRSQIQALLLHEVCWWLMSQMLLLFEISAWHYKPILLISFLPQVVCGTGLMVFVDKDFDEALKGSWQAPSANIKSVGCLFFIGNSLCEIRFSKALSTQQLPFWNLYKWPAFKCIQKAAKNNFENSALNTGM